MPIRIAPKAVNRRRLLAPVHDRPGSEARVPLAVAATVDGGTANEGVGRPSIAFVLLTVVTDEAIGEAFGVDRGGRCRFPRSGSAAGSRAESWEHDGSCRVQASATFLTHNSVGARSLMLAMDGLGAIRIGMV